MKMTNEKKEILETIWKNKWGIQPHTKVWWTKMCDDFYELGNQQILKEVFEIIDMNILFAEGHRDKFENADMWDSARDKGNEVKILKQLKAQISKELSGVKDGNN